MTNEQFGELKKDIIDLLNNTVEKNYNQKLTNEQKIEILKKYFYDQELNIIDLSEIDFGNMSIDNSGQKTNGNVFNNDQEIKGFVWNVGSKGKGDVFTDDDFKIRIADAFMEAQQLEFEEYVLDNCEDAGGDYGGDRAAEYEEKMENQEAELWIEFIGDRLE